MAFNAYIFYTSVQLNSLSIINIENFERVMNLKSLFSYEMISELRFPPVNWQSTCMSGQGDLWKMRLLSFSLHQQNCGQAQNEPLCCVASCHLQLPKSCFLKEISQFSGRTTCQHAEQASFQQPLNNRRIALQAFSLQDFPGSYNNLGTAVAHTIK